MVDSERATMPFEERPLRLPTERRGGAGQVGGLQGPARPQRSGESFRDDDDGACIALRRRLRVWRTQPRRANSSPSYLGALKPRRQGHVQPATCRSSKMGSCRCVSSRCPGRLGRLSGVPPGGGGTLGSRCLAMKWATRGRPGERGPTAEGRARVPSEVYRSEADFPCQGKKKFSKQGLASSVFSTVLVQRPPISRDVTQLELLGGKRNRVTGVELARLLGQSTDFNGGKSSDRFR